MTDMTATEEIRIRCIEAASVYYSRSESFKELAESLTEDRQADVVINMAEKFREYAKYGKQ